MGESRRDRSAGSFGGVFRGIRRLDWGIAAALTLLGTAQMYMNVSVTDAEVSAEIAHDSMAHVMTSHSVWMIPVWWFATVPVLWWRRNVVAVLAISLGAMVAHDLIFGWVGRCGAGLPLAFVLAFLGALDSDRARRWWALGLSVVLAVAVVAVDAITGSGLIAPAALVTLLIFAVGRAVRQRSRLAGDLRERTHELHRLRDERAGLEVAADRARVARELDELLQVRLDRLALAAETADVADRAGATATLERIETDARETLDRMRTLVGELRDGEVALAPTPTIAHLDAMLVRHTGAPPRLTVTGDPRGLTAAVELSAYRIVEHLVQVLAGRSQEPVEVDVRFADDALEIRVAGTVPKGVNVRAAAARARERAQVVGGSVDLRVARGRAQATASLPMAG